MSGDHTETDRTRDEADRQKEYMKGGKGRRDEVGRSGIFPFSSRDAPADGEVVSERDLVGHKGPRGKPSFETESRNRRGRLEAVTAAVSGRRGGQAASPRS
jgi:hypothetical protein